MFSISFTRTIIQTLVYMSLKIIFLKSTPGPVKSTLNPRASCFRLTGIQDGTFCSFVPNFIGKYGYKMRDDYLLYLHRSMELYPLYSQCFLTFGMSFERWVCVCRPHDAKQILNKRNRLWLIFGAIVLSVGVPSAFFADLIYHKDQNCYLKLDKKTSFETY